MSKSKIFWICTVCLIFLLFVKIERTIEGTYHVIEVVNPLELIVDYNCNGVADEGETVKILDGYQYISKDDIPNNEIRKTLNMDDYTMYAFAYLSQKFAIDTVLDKRVSVKTAKEGKIVLIGNDNYNEIIKKSGYIFKDNTPYSVEMFNKRIKMIEKSDYKIYNAKSGKYHNLTCKYGLLAHNYVILSKSQIPKGAKPCKFCMNDKYTHKKHPKSKTKQQPIKYLYVCLKNLKCPPLVYTNGAVKFYLIDYTTKLIPDRCGNTAICNELVKQINSAKSTIDMAIYGYDRVPKVEKALKNAISRGVKVRLVYDIDSNNTNIYDNTKEFASFIKDSKNDKAPQGYKNPAAYTNLLMHNKFFIFDKSTVMTGSANLSFTDMSGFNSNSVLLIRSPKIAEIYTEEFEQMYNSKFHNLKTRISDKENISLGNMKLSIYFSPKDLAIENVLIPLINKAQHYIYVPAFLITENRLCTALINARKRGVDVRVIVDATNAKNKYSKHKILRQNGVITKTENYAGKLHSKSIIIDDKYTVVGSMNFSRNGNMRNDENLIVIEDSKMAVFYKNFFNYLWSRISEYWLTHDVGAESVYSIGSCSDGIDNDYDGLIDMADEGCKMRYK